MSVEKTHVTYSGHGLARISLELEVPMGSTNEHEAIRFFEEYIKEWTKKWGFIPDDEILEVLWERAVEDVKAKET